jgi:hydrogenase expression/formation protein
MLRRGASSEFIKEGLVKRIIEIKQGRISEDNASRIADAVIEEAIATVGPKDDLLKFPLSGVMMGEFGVGSRGSGDFYLHEKIGELLGETSALVDSGELDDSGVVKGGGDLIILTVDGVHSRLSDYPFVAGFHVARAALRDVYAMGAVPLAMLSDIHLADDGDIGKIFDHIAGIGAVAELTGVPLITGSTLRIGGDMVIGERMTGAVGAVGVADAITARKDAEVGDLILMSEGAGGGTISTTALYYGEEDIVWETLNVKFLDACKALIACGLNREIHSMTDVTNGGIRGDAAEIAKVAGVKLLFLEDKIRTLVNPKVFDLLERHKIDYLGVSLDALLVICPSDLSSTVMDVVRSVGVRMDVIGEVTEGKGSEIVVDGKERDFTPRFRESAYTPIKKVVGEVATRDFDVMKRGVDQALHDARKKKEWVLERLKRGD